MAAELAALETETEQPSPAEFTLNFLWLDKNIAVSVDQLFDKVLYIQYDLQRGSTQWQYRLVLQCHTCTENTSTGVMLVIVS